MRNKEKITQNIFDFLLFIHAQKKVDNISEVSLRFKIPKSFVVPAMLDKGLIVKVRNGKVIANNSKGPDIIVHWKNEGVTPTMKTAEELYKIFYSRRAEYNATYKNKKVLKGDKKELYPISQMIEDRLGDWAKKRNIKTSDDLRRVLEIEFDVPDTEDEDPTELIDMIELLRMDEDDDEETTKDSLFSDVQDDVYDERSFKRDIEKAKSRFKEYSGKETEIEILVSIKTNKTIML